MTSAPTPAVLVTGMHRSGTSALTRCIALLGFDLGSGPLLGATETNVHGHWEPRSMVEINDDLLADLGGTWVCPPPTDATAAGRAALETAGHRARALFRDQFGTPFVVKDPRAALFVDVWMDALPPDSSVVLVLRHPAAVAASLRDRDGLSVGHGLALWERYCRAAVAACEGRRVAVIRYEAVVADPVAELGSLQEWLQCRVDPDEVDAAAASLDPGVIHHTTTSCTPLTGAQRLLWEDLQGLAGHHLSFHATLRSAETEGLQSMFDDRRRLLALDAEVERLHRELGDARAREADLRERQADLEQLLADERTNRLATETELVAMTAAATRLDALLADRQRILDMFTLARIRRPVRDRILRFVR